MTINEIFLLFFLNIVSYIILNFVLIKKGFLIDRVFDKEIHKKFINEEAVPLSGGAILLLNCFFLNFFDNFYYQFCFVILFFIGLLSDTANLTTPLKRLLMQFLLIIIFLYYQEVLIQNVRISFMDNLLDNKFYSILFTAFCFLILINGSNFIDGINFQSSGYYFALITSLILFNNEIIFETNLEIFFSIYIFLIVFIFFNILNKSFLGDGGIYLLSFIIGVLLIKMQNIINFSPYYAVVLLWYPAFENLFSIIRKILVSKKKPDQADTLHLHHLLITYIKSKLKFDNKKISLITSFSINILNFIFFSIASQFIYSTKILLLMIMFMCFVYLIAYNFLLKTKKK